MRTRDARALLRWVACGVAFVFPPSAYLAGQLSAIPEDRFVEVNGARLHYLDWGGSGPLLLMVHGVTTSAYGFAAIAPAFVDHYRVMAVTRRGHGASDSAPQTFDVDLMVDDLATFIRAFSSFPAVVVGMSHAGIEIPRLARRYPELVSALVFLDGIYEWRELLSDAPPDPGFATDSVYGSYDELDAEHAEMFAEFWSEAFRSRLHSQMVTGADGRIRWRPSPSGPALLGFLALWAEWDPSDFDSIGIPVLAVVADQEGHRLENLTRRGFPDGTVEAGMRWAREFDRAKKQKGLDLLLRSVPDAEVVRLEATHHLVQWHRTTEVIEAMSDFLDRRLGR